MLNTGKPPSGYFVTATGTEVGKTFVATRLVEQSVRRGRRVGVYKPVASGAIERDRDWISEDADLLWRAAGCPGTLAQVCPQLFRAPLAPPLAARLEGRRVDESLILAGLRAWQETCEELFVEGAGGLMSPISDSWLNCDMARQCGLPLLIVAGNRLGVVHDVLATVAAASAARLPVAGIILNAGAGSNPTPPLELNAEMLRQYCDVPLLACVAPQAATIDWP